MLTLRSILLAAAIAAVPTAARAGEWREARQWDTQDSLREGAMLTLLVFDWAQTRTIAAHPARWNEMNPILGSHPSAARVDAWFAASAVLHVVAAYALPPRWRTPFQLVSIQAEGLVVSRNVAIGIHGTWP
jgi:hypothetical protein